MTRQSSRPITISKVTQDDDPCQSFRCEYAQRQRTNHQSALIVKSLSIISKDSLQVINLGRIGGRSALKNFKMSKNSKRARSFSSSTHQLGYQGKSFNKFCIKGILQPNQLIAHLVMYNVHTNTNTAPAKTKPNPKKSTIC